MTGHGRKTPLLFAGLCAAFVVICPAGAEQPDDGKAWAWTDNNGHLSSKAYLELTDRMLATLDKSQQREGKRPDVINETTLDRTGMPPI